MLSRAHLLTQQGLPSSYLASPPLASSKIRPLNVNQDPHKNVAFELASRSNTLDLPSNVCVVSTATKECRSNAHEASFQVSGAWPSFPLQLLIQQFDCQIKMATLCCCVGWAVVGCCRAVTRPGRQGAAFQAVNLPAVLPCLGPKRTEIAAPLSCITVGGYLSLCWTCDVWITSRQCAGPLPLNRWITALKICKITSPWVKFKIGIKIFTSFFVFYCLPLHMKWEEWFELICTHLGKAVLYLEFKRELNERSWGQVKFDTAKRIVAVKKEKAVGLKHIFGCTHHQWRDLKDECVSTVYQVAQCNAI